MKSASRVAWQATGTRLSLTLPNDRQVLASCRDIVDSFLRAAAVDERVIYDVELVLEETLLNVILHAFADVEPHVIAVGITLCGDEVEVCVDDDGAPFDPTQATRPIASESNADAVVGGWGLVLIHAAVHSSSHLRVDGRNRLTLRLAPR